MDSKRLLNEDVYAHPFTASRPSRTTVAARTLASLLLLGVGILIGLIPSYMGKKTQESLSPIPSQLRAPSVPTIFAPDDRYIGPSTNAHRAWQHLLRNDEKVFVPSPAQFNLGPGFSPDSSFYRISNVHQLHCVNMVRLRYFDLLKDEPDPEYDPRDWAAHMEHCFEYLRLSITCGDTMVLEGSSPPGSPKEWREDEWGNPLGWGIRRECIDWEALVDWQGRMTVVHNRTR